MTEYTHQEIAALWLRDFSDLDHYGPPHSFSPWKLAGLYAVASICYHGNAHSCIEDEAFDRLCRWLWENFDECVDAGADKLNRDLLGTCSGCEVGTFMKAYHDIAAMLLGHACRCIGCAAAECDLAA